MDVLTRARRRLILRLSLLGTSVVAPIVGGLVWGVDGFLLGAFGIPAAAICLFAAAPQLAALTSLEGRKIGDAYRSFRTCVVLDPKKPQ